MGRVRLRFANDVCAKLIACTVSIPTERLSWQSTRCEEGKLVRPGNVFRSMATALLDGRQNNLLFA